MRFSSSKYTKTTITRDDGSFFNFIEVKIDRTKRLEFHHINEKDKQSKMLNIGQLRILKAKERGIKNPIVIVWDAFCNSMKTEDFFCGHERNEDIIHLSLNSFITFYLRYIIQNRNYIISNKKISVKKVETSEDKIVEKIIQLLENQNRIRIFMENDEVSMEYIYENLDEIKDCISVGNIGFPSSYSRNNEYQIVFNTSYFLLEEEDFISEFSRLGDTYSMMINKGIMEIPPIYNRYALFLDNRDQWKMKKVSLKDINVFLGEEKFELNKFTHNELSTHAVYTRYYGVKQSSQTFVKSPLNKENIDLVIIGQDVVGIKYYGEVQIPQNGFVLSIPIQEFNKLGYKFTQVDYEFIDGSRYKEALQCGPGIMSEGDKILNEQSLVLEEFYRKHFRGDGSYDYGVVPTDYSEDIDQSRHARILLGIDHENNVGLLAAEAVNKGMEIQGQEPMGATLLEMADLAKERGYKYVLNLDGGGSTNIQYLYGQLVRNADRRGLPGVLYERMVPAVGVIID